MREGYFRYDVGLSFAGEQRQYVEQVAGELKSRGIRVFFDDYERGTLWGKDLYSYLSNIYKHECRLCVIFASKEYAAKVWPNRERESSQARALEETKEYILPARFDDTPIPGLLETIGYIDVNLLSPLDVSKLIIEKLGEHTRRDYLPPVLDRLFDRLGIQEDNELQAYVRSHAWAFLDVLRRMSEQERKAVISLIRFGCPMELPDYVHIDTDLLRRVTGESVPTLKRVLGDIQSLGFACSLVEVTEDYSDIPGERLGEADMFYLTWSNLSSEDEFPALIVAHGMIRGADEDYCEEHGTRFLDRLDFSQLARTTATKEQTPT